jgi:hypothetical protein
MIGAHRRALVDLGPDVVVTTHRRAEVPSFLAGRVTANPSMSPTGTPSSL